MYRKWHKPWKFVLIGCGRTAHAFATVIHSHPLMTVSAVMDEDPEAAHAFGESFNCNNYTSLKDFMRGNDSADCAVICTSGSGHADTAVRLMRRGIHILYETPFAPDSVSAEKMIDASMKSGVHLVTDSRFRHIEDSIHARELIRAGLLGRILVFEIDFRDRTEKCDPASSLRKPANHGILMKRGNHAIDIAHYFFGPLLRVRVEEAQRLQSQVVEDTVRVDMRTVSGIIGTAQLSWKIKNPCDDYIRIYGTAGTLCIGWESSMYRLNGSADWTNFGEGYDTLRAVTRLMENFLNAISGREILENTAGNGLEPVRAIMAAYRSLTTGHWETLSPSIPELETPRAERNLTLLRPGKLATSNN